MHTLLYLDGALYPALGRIRQTRGEDLQAREVIEARRRRPSECRVALCARRQRGDRVHRRIDTSGRRSVLIGSGADRRRATPDKRFQVHQPAV